MRRLAPDLFDRRFQDLMEVGRARLPELAPDWTDHNAHDPGITLMELLAWVTEAQLYSLGRMRQDERAAYAALVGLAPGGTQPARGLIWPDRLDPRAPNATHTQSMVIAADAVVNMVSADMPTFRPAGKLLWVPGRISRLEARLADGRKVDYTGINERCGPAFQPFGAIAGAGDVLAMEFECRSEAGLFPAKRADAEGALWPIGVRADTPPTDGVSQPDAAFPLANAGPRFASLSATLVTAAGDRVALKIASDSSDGLLRTGALLLDLSAVKDSPQIFTLELRATLGFERPPRLSRIGPNVIPIVQGRPIPYELHVATGIPDWTFQLDVPGLRFAPSEAPVKVEMLDPDTDRKVEWQRCERLSESGPQDAVYEFDTASERVTFGNGLNGRIPESNANVLVTYAVSDGDQGGVAANRSWQVRGFQGSFGVNPDAVAGGAAATGWLDERREARRRARDDHALVSADDIEAAALALPLLEVARAWVLTPADEASRTGAVTLVVMRARASEEQAGAVPETRRWLEAIRRRLSARMPLATRLVMTAPRYIEFSIRASIEAAAGRDPATVRTAVENELRSRLALVGDAPRRPGVPVTSRDITAWIRAVEGIRRVVTLGLVQASGTEVDEISVPRNGLPRGDLASSAIDVRRAGSGAAS
ncbi:putative baseplate assembly protein [Bradyrhizobium sp. S3.2.12]|uniref:putative baseplate assembly protein n=1 Tax=Bradyrhizobium sp. S3.2.12 TaxID=3156387 RepID=UPI0033995880